MNRYIDAEEAGNVSEVAGVARRMEDMFQKTLARGEDFVMSFENRKKIRMWRLRKEYVDSKD